MKKTKKYQLINSYFKVNTMLRLPDTVLEIAEYEKEHGELPFEYCGSNWVYDACCERQKRRGMLNSQYLTPDATVGRMMHFAGKYFTYNNHVLEPCCGTGQITKKLIKDGYNVTAFDKDPELIKLCEFLYCGQANFMHEEFKQFGYNRKYDAYEKIAQQIIANPPYEMLELIPFLKWILDIQTQGGISVLLLPKGFVFKDKPKLLVNTLQQFSVQETEDMQEDFERTKCAAEIVVLKKL